ncbi:MAG: NAD(P)-binding protein, partial [Candidatus Hodarchaeota archaeon]
MHEKKIEEATSSDYDVIIAGGGAGGLLTSLALTGVGKKVLVLEAANRLGGVWHGYWVGDYRVDQG